MCAHKTLAEGEGACVCVCVCVCGFSVRAQETRTHARRGGRASVRTHKTEHTSHRGEGEGKRQCAHKKRATRREVSEREES